jgi:hypothetical protein
VREATAKHVVASAQKLHNCLLSLIKDVDFGPAQRKAHNERVYPELLSIYSSAQDWKKVYHLAGEIQKSPGVPEPFLAERVRLVQSRSVDLCRSFHPFHADIAGFLAISSGKPLPGTTTRSSSTTEITIPWRPCESSPFFLVCILERRNFADQSLLISAIVASFSPHS